MNTSVYLKLNNSETYNLLFSVTNGSPLTSVLESELNVNWTTKHPISIDDLKQARDNLQVEMETFKRAEKRRLESYKQVTDNISEAVNDYVNALTYVDEMQESIRQLNFYISLLHGMSLSSSFEDKLYVVAE